METLQKYGKWELNKYSQLKYFKNGKANMHVAISYCIEFNNSEAWQEAGQPVDYQHVETGVFWIKTKSEALREWKQFIKTHSIGGAQLKSELFESAV